MKCKICGKDIKRLKQYCEECRVARNMENRRKASLNYYYKQKIKKEIGFKYDKL